MEAQQDCHSTKSSHGRTAKANGDRELATFDILHQIITLDLTQGNVIAGACAISAVPRQADTDRFPLDLEALTVDSVTTDLGALSFAHDGLLLEVDLPTALSSLDTLNLTVHYSGDPIIDPSGFGGFYTGANLIYNLGVAFESIPHSYGRTWFPCSDNFTERSTYEFLIRTAGGKRAWCNGVLVGRDSLGGDTLINHWRIDQTIPAYLVSVAAAPYVVARNEFTNISGGVTPVELIAAPGDTTGMKSSFTHLEDAFDLFEDRFGPYLWDRVGYVLTTQGAMEHATSIHYPRSVATGSLQYEATMAHELAHHWFGNLITCERAEEMYINEGFAEYLSYLFLEQVHGTERYLTEVRNNHRAMVHRAHFQDEGWWALSEVPQEWTYGEHSYNKGADVLHTLRSYMGNEAFSVGLTSFLETFAFQSVNTVMLRDHLEATTGIPLTDFFADWIQQPGWAAFEIDEQAFLPVGSEWDVALTLQQKLRGPAAFYNNVPVTLTVIGQDPANVFSDTVMLGGEFTQVMLRTPFEPGYVWLNADDRIALAITASTDTLAINGSYNSLLANFEVTPSSNDPVVIRMEQYWVAPDEGTFAEPYAYVLSPDRYWRISGNWNDADRFTAKVLFDGRNTSGGNLDPGLVRDSLGVVFHEDSVVLLHRTGPSAPWVVWADQVNTLSDPTDGFGRMNLDSLQVGEYAFAWRKSAVGIQEHVQQADWRIRPNPATDEVVVSTDQFIPAGSIVVLDAAGKEVWEVPMTNGTARFSVQGSSSGSYCLMHRTSTGNRNFVGTLLVP